MRQEMLIAAVSVMLLASTGMSSLVSEGGAAPYYNTLEEAVSAAADSQLIAVDFFIDT